MWTDGSPYAAPSLEYTGLRYYYSLGRHINIDDALHFGTTEINPVEAYFQSQQKGSNCTTLVLLNLKRTEILVCNCNQKINYHTVCLTDVPGKLPAGSSYSNNETGCHIHAVKRKEKCYNIGWNHGETPLTFCSAKQMKDCLLVELKQLDFIIEVTLISPLLFLSTVSSASENVLHFNHKRATYVHYNRKKADLQGFQVCKSDKIEYPATGNMFECQNGIFISILQHCDEVKDCLDSSDEDNCFLDQEKQISFHILSKKQKAAYFDVCFSILYTANLNLSVNCSNFQNDFVQKSVAHYVSNKTFQCNDSSRIPHSQLDDSYFDCSTGEDEANLQLMLRLGIKAHCPFYEQIPCRMNHMACYKVHQVCVYKLSKTNHLVPCRDGNNLETCTKFECNMMFKCVNYYCIPWEYVCDNKWDCPRGTDEANLCGNVENRCERMYKCKNTSETCIHVGNTCDGNFNCPLQDDEYICELKDATCPQSCSCLLFALVCDNASFVHFLNRYPHLFVAFRKVPLQLIQIVKHFQNILNLEFVETKLTDICQLQAYSKIKRIIVTHNALGFIKQKCFPDLTELAVLVLSSNHILELRHNALLNLVNLRHLDLSVNNMTSFSSLSLVGTKFLEILCLQQNRITSIDLDDLSVRIMQVNSFHLCCFCKEIQQCKTTRTVTWYDSCENLLTKNLQITTMVLGCCTICLNIISVLLLPHQETISQQYIILARTVFLAEVLWGVYLVIIWIEAVSYRQSVSQKFAQSSTVCQALVYLSFIYFILDPAAVALLAFGRFRLTKKPMDTKFKQTVFCNRCAGALYSFSILLTCFCVFIFEIPLKQFSSIFCLPFIDPSNTQVLITAVTLFSSSYQLSVSICVAVCHYLVVKYVKESCVATKSSQLDTSKQNTLRTKLICMTTQDLAYWFALSVMFTTTKFLNKFSLFAFAWVVVSVVSFNPTLNPALYLLQTIRASLLFCKKHE